MLDTLITYTMYGLKIRESILYKSCLTNVGYTNHIHYVWFKNVRDLKNVRVSTCIICIVLLLRSAHYCILRLKVRVQS